MGRPRPDLEYHDAGAGRGRVAKHLAEIAVQRDERSPFSRAHFEQFLIRRASQPFTGHCNGIMAGGADQIGCAPAEVLVKLESHAALSVGTGMTRSRATSAPYAIAAKTSSWVSPGYSASNSASVMPSARKSRTSETQIRVPFMHGLPPQILGSIVIRCRRGFTLLPRMLLPAVLARLNGSNLARLRLSARAAMVPPVIKYAVIKHAGLAPFSGQAA